MTHTLRITILDREYVLRVEREEDAHHTRAIADYVDAKMRAFRQSHPDRPEVTTAVIAALAIAEDLFAEKEATALLLKAVGEAEADVGSLLGAVEIDSEAATSDA